MLRLVAIALLVCSVQESKKTTPADEEFAVTGLPAGEPATPPDRVRWGIWDNIAVRTPKRERVDLSGLWRFAAVPDRETPVLRSDMGWIEMPSLWSSEGAPVYDSRMRDADGVWRGKPLDELPIAWVERDIKITNDEIMNWMGRRVYLVLRGPWANAEVFTSQRFKGKGNEPDPVHVDQIKPANIDRTGERWFEITEQLLYPGTTQLSLRLTKADAEKNNAGEAKAYAGLELMPAGLRIDAIRTRRDPARERLELHFDIIRPNSFMLVGGPPVRSIPLVLRIRLDDAEQEITFHRVDQEIATMPYEKRTVKMFLPMQTAEKKEWPNRVRLRVQLGAAEGGTFDEPFPVEFELEKLEQVP